MTGNPEASDELLPREWGAASYEHDFRPCDRRYQDSDGDLIVLSNQNDLDELLSHEMVSIHRAL